MELRGTLIDFDAGSYTATIQLYGVNLGRLQGIKTSRAVPSSEMLPGRTVIISLVDVFRLPDSVIIGVF